MCFFIDEEEEIDNNLIKSYEDFKQNGLYIIKYCLLNMFPIMFEYVEHYIRIKAYLKGVPLCIIKQEEKNYTKIMCTLRNNFLKLEKIVPLLPMKETFNFFVLIENIVILSELYLCFFFNLSDEEKLKLMKETIKKLRKTTKEVNKYYKKYILKPQEKKNSLNLMNMNTVYYGIAENIYNNSKSNDPEIIEEISVTPEQVIKEEIRKCI